MSEEKKPNSGQPKVSRRTFMSFLGRLGSAAAMPEGMVRVVIDAATADAPQSLASTFDISKQMMDYIIAAANVQRMKDRVVPVDSIISSDSSPDGKSGNVFIDGAKDYAAVVEQESQLFTLQEKLCLTRDYENSALEELKNAINNKFGPTYEELRQEANESGFSHLHEWSKSYVQKKMMDFSDDEKYLASALLSNHALSTRDLAHQIGGLSEYFINAYEDQGVGAAQNAMRELIQGLQVPLEIKREGLDLAEQWLAKMFEDLEVCRSEFESDSKSGDRNEKPEWWQKIAEGYGQNAEVHFAEKEANRRAEAGKLSPQGF